MKRLTDSELRESIVEAVAELDQCDGSRIGQSEAIDAARNILQTAYGDQLDDDVQDFIDSNAGDTDDEESIDGNADDEGSPDEDDD